MDEQEDSDVESQYPSEDGTSEESSSESSDDQLALTGAFDKEFFKCYSALKRKDPKIYDDKYRFFQDSQPTRSTEKPKSKKGMSLLEYQIQTSSDPLESQPSGSKYERDLVDIKNELLEIARDVDDQGEDLFIVKKRPEASNHDDPLAQANEDQDLAYIKDLWCKDNLDEREKFMRDFITKKTYLEKLESDDIEEEANVETHKHVPHTFKTAEELEASNPTVPKLKKAKYHSEEADSHQLARIPRNATNTVRDMQRKTARNEARRKKREKKKQERAQLLGQLKDDEPIFSKKEKKKKKLKEPAPYEDVVAGVPTKFKYRETVANDFGLTNEELLFATDEELNRWASLKKTVAYRSDDQETYDVKAYQRKASNTTLKKQIFKSLYGSDDEQPVSRPETEETTHVTKKSKKRGLNHKRTKQSKSGLSEERLLAYGLSKKRLKKSKLL